MEKYIFLLLVLVILINPLAAEKPKSAVKAMLLSAVVPGAGQGYQGKYTKMGVFLASELLLVGTTVRLNQEVDWSIDKYQQFAYNKTGIVVGSSKDTYQNMQNYISSDEYNADMEHDAWRYFVLGYDNLEAYNSYVEANRISEDDGWDWENDKTWQKYKDYRYEKQNLEMYGNLVVAAVVLNHLVGVIDAALTGAKIRRESKRHTMYIDPDISKNRLRLGYAYKF